MERKLLNNNDRSFSVDGEKGKKTFILARIESADDFSFYSYGQSLAVKIMKDDEVFSSLISKYKMDDDEGKVAVINQKFENFNDLTVEIFSDNPLLSADINFNVIVDYELR